ncbi:MAG: glycoside hydrolase family 3 N-terminal domain-containing protein, partial [Thermodesulfovibrionales bacterium]
RDEIIPFIHELRSLAETPLFIASDIERGVGQQIEGSTSFPCPMATAAAISRENPEDLSLLREMVGAIAAEALAAGIDMPFLPVLDVNSNPDNPIICTRAFSDRPEEVAWFGKEYIKTLEAGGLLSCGKHFPGHGDTAVDSHMALPVIRKSQAELRACEIPPFAAGIEAGVSCIMAGHLTVPALDELPATLSRKVLIGLLREELGFQGLIITDALNMDALREMGNVPALCMAAGADILLHPRNAHETVRELASGIASGMVDEARIDEALTRIALAQKKVRREGMRIDYEKNRRLSQEITRRSITLVKETEAALPLTDRQGITLFFAGDQEMYDGSLLCRQFRTMPLTDHTGFTGGIALFCLFTRASAWKGSSDIGQEEISLIKKVMAQADRSIVISFGSPYSLRHFPEAEILIAAYEANEQAQMAVLETLLEGRFTGRLPVRIFHGRD